MFLEERRRPTMTYIPHVGPSLCPNLTPPSPLAIPQIPGPGTLDTYTSCPPRNSLDCAFFPPRLLGTHFSDAKTVVSDGRAAFLNFLTFFPNASCGDCATLIHNLATHLYRTHTRQLSAPLEEAAKSDKLGESWKSYVYRATEIVAREWDLVIDGMSRAERDQYRADYRSFLNRFVNCDDYATAFLPIRAIHETSQDVYATSRRNDSERVANRALFKAFFQTLPTDSRPLMGQIFDELTRFIVARDTGRHPVIWGRMEGPDWFEAAQRALRVIDDSWPEIIRGRTSKMEDSSRDFRDLETWFDARARTILAAPIQELCALSMDSLGREYGPYSSALARDRLIYRIVIQGNDEDILALETVLNSIEVSLRSPSLDPERKEIFQKDRETILTLFRDASTHHPYSLAPRIVAQRAATAS